MSIKAIFLDRDGTLVKDYEDDQWPLVKKLELFPDTIPALQKIPNDFKLFIITNQYLIQENFITIEQFKKLHRQFFLNLEKNHIHIEQTYFCPHPRSMNCLCRKPGGGMIDQCLTNYDVDLSHSYFIGNSKDDIRLGNDIGCTTIAVRDYQGSTQPDYFSKDLVSAITKIELHRNPEHSRGVSAR